MSLGIAFKGPEGIVLAADSRVTLTAQLGGDEKVTIPVTFDNATKLLRVTGQDYVGVVTYGAGVIGQQEPRTAHSFLPEFEGELQREVGDRRLSVEDFSKRLSAFFMAQWSAGMPADYRGPDMTFLVGGYNEGAPYGKVFQIDIPHSPDPTEWQANGFGLVWGGQKQYATRLIHGFDPMLPSLLQEPLGLSADKCEEIRKLLQSKLQAPIPFMFLPLQDCVDLSVLLIRTTIAMQTFMVGVRGVGGAIDVATITRTEGFRAIRQKKIIAQESPRGVI